jgi:lipid-binding SYLF domain-containing protein
MRAEILSYSRARGTSAGIFLEGSTLRPDDLIVALQKSSPQLKR